MIRESWGRRKDQIARDEERQNAEEPRAAEPRPHAPQTERGIPHRQRGH